MNGNSGPNGTLILVLGILSIICLPILGPVAWIMGNGAMTQLSSGQGDESQRGTVNAGRICGIIGTVLGVLGMIWWFTIGGAVMREAARQAQTAPR